jgi:phosphatidylserine synthase
MLTWTVTPALIWLMGFNGVSLAALVISGGTLFLPILYVQRTIPFRFWENVWRQTVATLAMTVIALLGFSRWNDSFLWLLLGIVLSGIAYGGTFLLIGWRSLKSELRSMGVIA